MPLSQGAQRWFESAQEFYNSQDKYTLGQYMHKGEEEQASLKIDLDTAPQILAAGYYFDYPQQAEVNVNLKAQMQKNLSDQEFTRLGLTDMQTVYVNAYSLQNPDDLEIRAMLDLLNYERQFRQANISIQKDSGSTDIWKKGFACVMSPKTCEALGISKPSLEQIEQAKNTLMIQAAIETNFTVIIENSGFFTEEAIKAKINYELDNNGIDSKILNIPNDQAILIAKALAANEKQAPEDQKSFHSVILNALSVQHPMYNYVLERFESYIELEKTKELQSELSNVAKQDYLLKLSNANDREITINTLSPEEAIELFDCINSRYDQNPFIGILINDKKFIVDLKNQYDIGLSVIRSSTSLSSNEKSLLTISDIIKLGQFIENTNESGQECSEGTPLVINAYLASIYQNKNYGEIATRLAEDVHIPEKDEQKFLRVSLERSLTREESQLVINSLSDQQIGNIYFNVVSFSQPWKEALKEELSVVQVDPQVVAVLHKLEQPSFSMSAPSSLFATQAQEFQQNSTIPKLFDN
ncbi:MAG: hypothetical protein EP298_09805 [Gammaproteobacteria bacterium]|nr:MAG: hypothetical protein EP298_09805 [Gammaproteobacteria bacterium]UTW42941.1 hypothetical protein KFE69_02030 [bacterium SCSIO 12844]